MSNRDLYVLTRRHCLGVILLYFLFSAVVVVIAPFIGAEHISLHDIMVYPGGDAAGNASRIAGSIFFQQRLPRVWLGFLAGGGLAVVGAVFQTLLRNPLAGPYTLGITSGGALGAVVAISIPSLAFKVGYFSSVQVFSLIGSAVVLFFIYQLARRQSKVVSTNMLLLAGVTLGILCSALILFVRYMANPDMLVSMDRWLMGGIDIIGYQQLGAILPFWLPGMGLLFMQISGLNHLVLGEEMAAGYGVNVRAVQRNCFVGGSVLTAGVVSVTGPIGFVGLLVPHIVRKISGNDHRIVAPGAFLAGGAFLVICDTLARTIVAPTEMPAGIFTAILGGVFFIYLLIRQ